MLALSMSTERGANQNKSGEVRVRDINEQLDIESHNQQQQQHQQQLNSGSSSNHNNKRKAPIPRLTEASLKKLLEYLRLSESGAVIKVSEWGSEELWNKELWFWWWWR